MASTIEKVKTGIANSFDAAAKMITTGAQKLRDSQNVDSEIVPGDLEKKDAEPAWGRAADLIALGNKRYERSRNAFWTHAARDFFTGIARYEGDHYSVWNPDSGSMGQASDGGNPDELEKMLRVTTNVVAGKIDLAVARIMAAWPDAIPAPMTDSEKDKIAAQIARSVCSHAERVTDMQRLVEEAMLAACISTNVYLEPAWDNHAEADIGLPSSDGSIEYMRRPMGEITLNQLLAIDAYPDPAASMTGDIHSGAYFVKKEIRSVSYIKQKWGKTVEPTALGNNYGFLRQRLSWISGDRTSQQSNIDSAEVTSVWEKPSPQYRKGRFWVYSGQIMLWAGWWPYEKKDRYPFVKFGFKKNTGSIWDLNMIRSLEDAQVQLNGLDSYLYARQMWDRPTEYVPRSAKIAPPDLLNPSLGRTVTYVGEKQGGELPTYKEPPAPGDFWFTRRQTILQTIDLISGVRDFNTAGMPPPSSGFEFQLRIQEDRTRLGPVTRHVAQSVVELKEWMVALYRQYGATAPRMLGLDDKGIPLGQAAATALVDLRGLKDGNCRVVLMEGSGEYKLPAAREEFLDQFVTMAAKGVPPPLLKWRLEQSQWIASDATTDNMLREYEAYWQQKQAQALQVQQMKGDQAQQQAQAKAEQVQAQEQAQVAAEQEKAAIGVHSAAMEQQFRAEVDQQNEQQRANNAAALETMKFEHAIQLADVANNAPPSISISLPGKLGPKAIASIEEQHGITPDSPDVMTKLLAPPTPQAQGSKPNAKKSQ